MQRLVKCWALQVILHVLEMVAMELFVSNILHLGVLPRVKSVRSNSLLSKMREAAIRFLDPKLPIILAKSLAKSQSISRTKDDA